MTHVLAQRWRDRALEVPERQLDPLSAHGSPSARAIRRTPALSMPASASGRSTSVQGPPHHSIVSSSSSVSITPERDVLVAQLEQLRDDAREK